MGNPTHAGVLLHVLLTLAAVIVVGRGMGWLLRRFGQPPVLGEVVAGILLGPSLLGREVSSALLPGAAAPVLHTIAQLGVILYMFLVGLGLNAGELRRHGRASLVIAGGGMAVPFAFGVLLAPFLFARLAGDNATTAGFALFLGVALSVTAFPVLARILADRKMSGTELGVLALTCAATGDAAAWSLLALVVGIVQAKVGGALLVVAFTFIYVAAMVFVARPVLARLAFRWSDAQVPPGATALVFAGVLLSAAVTEWIGIHGLFGAFLLGLVPHDSPLARAFTHKLEDVVTVLLLPAFFAFTGMRTEIGLVSGIEAWLVCGLLIVVATAGKMGGTLAAARLCGRSWHDAAALGVLMNTRGLMELIVLNVGLDLGVISPALFAMLVLMALATTFATGPLLHLLAMRSRADCKPASKPTNTTNGDGSLAPPRRSG